VELRGRVAGESVEVTAGERGSVLAAGGDAVDAGRRHRRGGVAVEGFKGVEVSAGLRDEAAAVQGRHGAGNRAEPRDGELPSDTASLVARCVVGAADSGARHGA